MKCNAKVFPPHESSFMCTRERGHDGACKGTKLLDVVTEQTFCAWCGDELPPWMRSDAETCSKACRQARNRFRVAPAGSKASKPMRFGYADPPYPKLAKKYYGKDKSEVDHKKLVRQLAKKYPQGYALSTSSKALPHVLAIVRQHARDADIRVCAWVKGSRPGVSMRSRNAWEAVIVVGGRPRRLDVDEVLDDVLVCGVSSRARSHPGALVGMKPAAFCEWLFRLLGAARGDELDDLFPGSGAVTRAWKMFQSPTTKSGKPSRLAGAQRKEPRMPPPFYLDYDDDPVPA